MCVCHSVCLCVRFAGFLLGMFDARVAGVLSGLVWGPSVFAVGLLLGGQARSLWVGWLVGRWLGWLVGWSVVLLVAWLVRFLGGAGWLVGWFVAWLVG